MPITNFQDELTTVLVLETMIYYLQRSYLLFKGGLVQSYGRTSILQTQAPVPVPDSTGSSGAGIGGKIRFRSGPSAVSYHYIIFYFRRDVF